MDIVLMLTEISGFALIGIGFYVDVYSLWCVARLIKGRSKQSPILLVGAIMYILSARLLEHLSCKMPYLIWLLAGLLLFHVLMAVAYFIAPIGLKLQKRTESSRNVQRYHSSKTSEWHKVAKRPICLLPLLVLFVLVLLFVAHKKPVSDNKAESPRSQLSPCQEPATIQPAVVVSKRQRKKISSFIPNASRAVPEEKVEIMSESIAPAAENVGMSGQLASEKNRIMDELLNLPVIPSDYGDVMVELFRDRSQDVITRDFAVQHIGLYAQALSRRGVYNPDSADARNCRAALLEAADETRTIVAAAALRALADVAQFDPRIDGRRLDDRLPACAADASASVAARVMAVQLCGERRVASVIPALRRLSADHASPEPLRRAANYAISAIGESARDEFAQ